jgi:hypothetical protein
MRVAGIEIWTLLSPLTSVLALLIGVYLYRSGKNRPEIKPALMLTLLLSVGAALDFALSITPNETLALIFGRVLIFTAEICIGAIMFMSLMQLPPQISGRILKRKNELLGGIVIIAALVALNINELSHDEWGYGVAPSFGLNLGIAAYLGFTIASMSILTYSCRMSDDRIVKRKMTWMAAALPMPLLYAMATAGIESVTNFHFPRPIMPGFTIMVIMIAYAVWRYKLFIEVPAIRESRPLMAAPRSSPTQLGKSYLVEAKKPDMAYGMLLDDLALGAHGLIITREHPELVRESRGLATTPILWLTSTTGRDRIEPTNLSILQHTIIEHLRRGESPVILLDGLEYILANNKIEKVLQLVLALRDEIIVAEGKFIVPVDPRTMDPRSLAFFERDLEVVLYSDLN